MRRPSTIAVALLATLACCEVQPNGLVADDTGTTDIDDTSVDDSDTGDTSADTDATDTSDTSTADDTGAVDVVATCAVPDLMTLHPGFLPASPWALWESAPSCLEARHDAIIILGCPSDADGTSSSCQEGRVDLAMKFAQAGYGDRFIVTGGAVANAHVEAYALRDLLVAEGVPEASIETEPVARHTDENLYYSGLIMTAKGWDTAIVISEPEHLWYTAVCDANCCVEKGRLSAFQYHVGATGELIEKAATYVLYPTATTVSDGECSHIETSTKLMCTNMDDRKACADDFQL